VVLTAIFAWSSLEAERCVERDGEKPKIPSKIKNGKRNKRPLPGFWLRRLGMKITKRLSRGAGRDLQITSAARGVAFA
jgi:hypothetical protein